MTEVDESSPLLSLLLLLRSVEEEKGKVRNNLNTPAVRPFEFMRTDNIGCEH